MADCGCKAVRASGDPAGMSISGLGGFGRVTTRGGSKKKSASRKRSSSRAKALQSSGAFCVLTKTGAKFSCNFKSRAAAEKMARGKSGWKVTANGGGSAKPRKKTTKKKARR